MSDGTFRQDGLMEQLQLGLCAIASRLIPDKCCGHDTAKAFMGMLLQLQPLAVECAMYLRGLAALAAASLMAGCAIHPEPEDVTGIDTATIVKQIRCETRDAARMIILDELRRMAERRNDPIARDLLALYTEDQERMVDFDANRLFPGPFYKHTRELFALLYAGATAYTLN